MILGQTHKNKQMQQLNAKIILSRSLPKYSTIHQEYNFHFYSYLEQNPLTWILIQILTNKNRFLFPILE